MAKAKRTDSVMSRFVKMNHAPDHIEGLTQDARKRERDLLGELLATTDNPDDKKKIRRQLRRRGHYISKAGKPWMNSKTNAKRTRKANAVTDIGGEPTQPTADEAIGETATV